jgi:hypothetical protein
MNIVEYLPANINKDIAFCIVDYTKLYQDGIKELIKNQADGVIANVFNKGYSIFQWVDEDALIKHAALLDYKYAVVVSTGTEFINGRSFFDSIEQLIQQDFFIAGHILDRKDAYYELHQQCYIINLATYKKLNYPSIGKQELGARHTQDVPWRSYENWHDDYTPKSISGGDQTKDYNHKCHGWNILKTAFDYDETVLVFNESIRDNKIHMYPESPIDFYKQLEWAYHRLHYCQDTFVHTSNTETVHLPAKQYNQIVTPASGNWFTNFLAPGGTVVMYDYNQLSLDYWQGLYPEYKFVKCNLLTTDDLVAHIDCSIPDTLVNLSNIFNYEGTVFFYSLDYRRHKEQELISSLKTAIPTIEIYSSLSAVVSDNIPTWHL